MRPAARKHPGHALSPCWCSGCWCGVSGRGRCWSKPSGQARAMTVTIEEEGRTRVIDRYSIPAPVDGSPVACIWMSATLLSRARPCWALRRWNRRCWIRAAAPRPRRRWRRPDRPCDGAHRRMPPTPLPIYRQRDSNACGRWREGADLTRCLRQGRNRIAHRAATLRSADFNVEVARYELEAAESCSEYPRSGSGDNRRTGAGTLPD